MTSAAAIERLSAGLVPGLLIFLAMLALLRPRLFSAAARHRLWWATLVAVVLCSLAGFRAELAIDWPRAAVDVTSPPARATAAPTAARRDRPPVTSALRTRPPELAVRTSSLPPVAERVAFWLLVVWASVALALLLRLAWGVRQLVRFKRQARTLSGDLVTPGGRTVPLLASDTLASPVLVGLVRPAIIVPEALTDESDVLEEAVEHELAHLERRDDWTLLAEKLVLALFWFQPAAWWIARRLAFERELASDEWVIARRGQPRRYALALTRIAEHALGGPAPLLAAAALQSKSQLARRIEMLLDRSRPLSPFARRGFAFAFAVLLVLAVAGASHFGTPLVRAATPLPAPLAPVSPDHLTPLPGTPAPPAAMRGDVVAYGDDGEVIDPDQLANEVEARLADVQAQLEAEVEAAAAQAAEQSLPAAERRAVANRAREQAERAMAQAKREIELQVAAEMRTAARELRIANGEEWDECRGVEPRIPRRDVIALLEESFVKDPDPQVRSMALDRLTCWDRSLARIDGLWTQTADAEMKSLLMDRLAQLAARGDDGALNRLVRLTGESDEDLAAMAISHLGAIGSPRATEALAAILGSRRPAQLRAMALEGLSRGNSAEGLEALKRAARSDRDAEVRAHALALLSEPRFDSEVPPAPPSPPTAPLPPGVPAAPHAE